MGCVAALVGVSCGAPGEDGDGWSSDPSSHVPDMPGATTNGLANDLTGIAARRPAVADAASAGDLGAGAATDLGVATSALTSSSQGPAVVYLIYADGKTVTKPSPDPCPTTAPKFVCQFASTLQACQEQIQAYLDRWYASFNIVFTLTRPTSGWYYTEVVSSGGGAWCNAKDTVGGIAPFLCSDLAGGVSYTFAGGRTAKETAVIIAQEQAHLVGLEHTASAHDLMYPTICSDCDGFEDVDNSISGDVCGRPAQNSYQMMLDRLGPWTGGVKPTPFGCVADSSAPSVSILEPSDGATVASTFLVQAQASDDCKIAKATIRVSPMGLQATSTSAPYEWTLTRITGRQTVTVTVTDPSNKTTSTSITVNAPSSGAAGTGGSGTGGKSGAAGGAGASSGSGAHPATGTEDAGVLLDAALSAHTETSGGCDVGGGRVARTAEAGGRGGWMTGLIASVLLGLTSLARRRPSCRTARAARSARP